MEKLTFVPKGKERKRETDKEREKKRGEQIPCNVSLGFLITSPFSAPLKLY